MRGAGGLGPQGLGEGPSGLLLAHRSCPRKAAGCCPPATWAPGVPHLLPCRTHIPSHDLSNSVCKAGCQCLSAAMARVCVGLLRASAWLLENAHRVTPMCPCCNRHQHAPGLENSHARQVTTREIWSDSEGASQLLRAERKRITGFAKPHGAKTALPGSDNPGRPS